MEELNNEELDRALYDCMTVIWAAYRQAVVSGNYACFNLCFDQLYDKYSDDKVRTFIKKMGLGLVPAINKRIGG